MARPFDARFGNARTFEKVCERVRLRNFEKISFKLRLRFDGMFFFLITVDI